MRHLRKGKRVMIRLTIAMGLLLTLVVCSQSAPPEPEPRSGLVVNKEKKQIVIDGKIAPRKINDPRFKEIYPIEVIAAFPFPRGAKAHETVVTTDVKPSQVHQALEELGLKPGKPVFGEDKNPPQGPEVNIFLEFKGTDNVVKKIPIEKALVDPKTNKNLPRLKWRFTGSIQSKPDPDKPDTVYGADLTGTLITIFPVTNQTVFQTNLTMKEEKFVKLETDKKVLPPEGTPCKLILELP